MSEQDRIDDLDDRVRMLEGEVNRIPQDLDPRLRELEASMRLVGDSAKRIESMVAQSNAPELRAQTCPHTLLMTRIEGRLADGNRIFDEIRAWQSEHARVHEDKAGLGGVVARVDSIERDLKRLITAGWFVLSIFVVSLLQRIAPRVWESVAKAVLGG